VHRPQVNVDPAFAALVEESRLALGLHYPTDVLAGAALGTALALGSLALF
jgi:undecaprenyl-diphosphatase